MRSAFLSIICLFALATPSWAAEEHLAFGDVWATSAVWVTLIGTILGGFIAGATGWVAQNLINNQRDRQRLRHTLNGVGSEIVYLSHTLKRAGFANDMIRTKIIAEIDNHTKRYYLMGGDMGILPPDLVADIDNFYALLTNMASASQEFRSKDAFIGLNSVVDALRIAIKLMDKISQLHDGHWKPKT